MKEQNQHSSENLVEHFFRNEYGKLVTVITRYLGIGHLETAEDIVQETLLTAVEIWKHDGIPPNPEAWLYTTAKNKTLNYLRKQQVERRYQLEHSTPGIETLDFSTDQIADEQLRMMLRCCHPSIAEEVQITLILKILCGFSIAEIATAFCTNNEAINKRLVRGRKKLRKTPHANEVLHKQQDVLLKAIYLLFNEGYFPARKNQLFRVDLCMEAIRLAHIIALNNQHPNKEPAHSLLALMYLNVSRFEARQGKHGEVIEMERQDRHRWNQPLINKGLHHLQEAQAFDTLSTYLILASISANHCIARDAKATNWPEIVALYDALLTLENTPIVQLNRFVARSKTNGIKAAITGLEELGQSPTMKENHLYFSTLAAFYQQANEPTKAKRFYGIAISLCKNDRDKDFLRKKIDSVVPISEPKV